MPWGQIIALVLAFFGGAGWLVAWFRRRSVLPVFSYDAIVPQLSPSPVDLPLLDLQTFCPICTGSGWTLGRSYCDCPDGVALKKAERHA